MFDTPERTRHQFRAGEDGRAEFKEVRVGDRGVLSPNTNTLDDMPCRTFTRNQLLVSVLSRLRSKRSGQV